MFILLSQLINKANLSGMHLMIRPMNDGQLQVIVATESTEFKAEDPALKAALAQPLSVQGSVTNIDSLLTQSLTAFCESYTEVAQLTSVDDVVKGHNEAKGKAKAKADKSSNETNTAPAAPSAAESQDDDDDPDLF